MKRAAILDAARDLFFKLGVMPVSIDAIAKRAGVSRMTVYAHFGDKQTLFREVIKRQATTLASAIAIVPPSGSPTSNLENLREELATFGITFVDFLSRPEIKAWNRLRQEEAKNYPDLARTFTQGASVVKQTLVARLEKAQKQGLLRVTDPEPPARQLIGMLASLDVNGAIGIQQSHTEATINKHVEDCVAAFLRAYDGRST